MKRVANTSSRLKRRLTLQQETRTPDDVGGFARSWSNVADLWAEIIPLTGTQNGNREYLFAGQLQSEVTHRILLRYRNDITTGHRLVFESRAFNIRYVINSREENETLEILAEEGVAS